MMSMIGFSTGCFHKWSDDVNEQIRLVRELSDSNAIEVNMFSSCTPQTFTDESLRSLSSFAYVSLHAPKIKGLNREQIYALLKNVETVKSTIRAQHVIIHPDEYADFSVLAPFILDPIFENMDGRKKRYAHPKDFKEHKKWEYCLDLCHVWENDKTMNLAHEFLTLFGSNLREIHLSGDTEALMHAPLHKSIDKEKIIGLIKGKNNIPIICEGTFEKGDKKGPQKELDFIRSRL